MKKLAFSLLLLLFVGCVPSIHAIHLCKKPTCIKIVSADLKHTMCNKYGCFSTADIKVAFKNNTEHKLLVRVVCMWSYDGKKLSDYREKYVDPYKTFYMRFFKGLGFHKDIVDIKCYYRAKKVE